MTLIGGSLATPTPPLAPGTTALGVISWRELSADVYSFGLICSQILTGEDPYPNDLNWKEWGANIVAGEVRPTLPAACPPELRTLLNSCWGMMSPESSSIRPTFSYIRRALEHLVALPVRTHSYSSIYDDPADEVMVVTALINTVIDLTRTERRTRSCEDLENLREQLEVIQVDVVKIEVQLWVLRKKMLYMVEQSASSIDCFREEKSTLVIDCSSEEQSAYSIDCFSEEQDIVRMVVAWLKTLQHALNLTASELRSAHPGTMSHFLLHLESFDSTFLMHMKILEHTKEINELAKNREVLALQLKNLLSCYNFGRLQNSERHGQFLLIHQTPSFVFLETLFGLLNGRDQEILKEQFRRVLHPIGLRRSMEKLHPTREALSSSFEFHTSTTAGMGDPHDVHDIQRAMMLDEVEPDPWLPMEMDASPETGNAIMLDSSGAIMPQSISSAFKAWRHAHVVPRRSEGSTHQCLLHRGVEFLRHIPRVEAQAGSSEQQSFGLSAPRPTSSSSSKLLPFAPDEVVPSRWQKPPREEARIGTPAHSHPAMHHIMMSERRRRIKLSEHFLALQELLPMIISKNDKASIIGNAVIHLKNLQKQIDALEANMAELTSQNEKLKLSNQRLQEKNKQLEAIVSGPGPVLNP